MTSFVKRFLACESGATSIEYSLIAVGVSLAIAAAVPLIGTSVSGMFSSLVGYL